MTRVRVISEFHDRADYSRVYKVGQEVDFEDKARVRSIVERGLGEIVEEPVAEIYVEEADKPVAVIADNTPKPKKRTTKKNGK